MGEPHYCQAPFKRLRAQDEPAPPLTPLLLLDLARASHTDPHAETTAPPRGRSHLQICQSSATLHAWPHILPSCQLRGLTFRATLRARGFTPGQEQLGAGLRSSVLPPQGCWDCRDTCPVRTLLHQTAAMPPSPKTQSLLSAFFFFSPFFASLWFFFGQIIPGNSLF